MIITESVDATFGVLANFDLTLGLVKKPWVFPLMLALSISTSFTKLTIDDLVGAPPFVPIATDPIPDV